MEKMYVKVEKQKLVGCFTCPLCHKLLDQATTISECLHTFCRTCIQDKFIKEYLKTCPVCNVQLGVCPLDKLRTDNSWEVLRQRVFQPQPKPESIKGETVSSGPILQKYSRKKEQPLSLLLMASSSRAPTLPESDHDSPLEPNEVEGKQLGEKVEVGPKIRMSSTPTQKAGEGESEGYIQKDDSEELQSLFDKCKSLSTSDKEVAPLKRNDSAAINPNCRSEECSENSHILISSDDDTEEDSGEKTEKSGKEKQDYVHNFSGDARKISGEKGKGKSYSPPVLRPRKEMRNNNTAGTSKSGNNKDAEIKVEGSNEEAENKVEASNKRVWFSLVASQNQITDRPLAQIGKAYISVKNGNITVSNVKKYIAKKLNLESEDQVEIWLRHEPVRSTVMMNSLVDWWLHTTPASERKIPVPGSPAPELVMVLHYSRKLTSL